MDKPGRPLPPLDLLRGFEAAARHMSFTRAAAELFVTQSAVSRQVQALEEFLGVELFERRHKALALTTAGHAYQRAVAAALDELRDATRRLREQRNGRVLTVTTTVSFASIWLVPRLGRWRKVNPRVDVRITATHEVVDMEREGIDVAVRDCAIDRVPPGAVQLASEHLVAVCAPDYAKQARAEGKPLGVPADLRHHVLLDMHDSVGRWPWLAWAGWLEPQGIIELEPAGTITFDQYDQLMQAALLGQGVALGRWTLAEQYIRAKKLVPLFGKPRTAARGYHAIVSPRARDRVEAKEFVEWLQREIGQQPGPPGATPGKGDPGQASS